MKNRQNQSLNTAIRSLIQERLLLPVIVVSLVILAFAAVYGGRVIEKQQISYSHSVGYAAQEFLNFAAHEMEAIAYAIHWGNLDDILIAMESNWSTHSFFDTFYLLDGDGFIQLLVPSDSRYIGLDMSRQSYFASADCAQEVTYSKPFTSLRTGQPTVFLTQCLEDGRYLVGELNLTALQRTIQVGETVDSPTTVFVADQDGTLLAHPEQQLVAQQTNISDWTVFQQGLISDTINRYFRDGRMWIGSASKIWPTNWVVVTEVPAWVVYSPYLGAMFALVFFLVIIFSLMVRGLFGQLHIRLVNPLTQLSMGTDALSAGDYSASEKLDATPDTFLEINHLVTNFQNMSKAILSRETLLREGQDQYRRLVELSPDAIVVHSSGKMIFVNAAALRLYGAKSPDDLIGRDVMELVHPDSKSVAQMRLEKLSQPGNSDTLPRSDQKHIRMDNSVFDAEVTTSTIIFGNQHAAQSIVRDITQRKDEEQRLKHLATHDYLTNLPNRFLFQDRLYQSITKSLRSGASLAILYLDLDNFKEINDAFGHSSGDRVLQQIGQILQNVIRESDTVARIGGDEFVILLSSITDPRNAALVAEKILKAFSAPIHIQTKEIYLSWSIGISIFPNDGENAQFLLQAADAAMYHAKEEGKNRFAFFAAGMRSQSLERLALTNQLRQALEREEFFLEYQPQVNSSTGELFGVEALIRWHHPDLGVVSPGRFIPLAEETNLIVTIGEWVIRTVCQQAYQWQKISPLRVAINLADRQLRQSGLPDIVQQALTDSGFLPELLELELNENIIFRNAQDAFRSLYTLKDLGLTLAIDDFGTGYSTLSYLAQFPFDRLKIDQRLAPNITSDPKDAAIVAGIITIGQNLGMQVIAEGVETPEQLSFYENQGCFDFQGWYYSRAVSADEITGFLEKGTTWKKK